MERNEEKQGRTFKSRPHSKKEKRKQRKNWLKRKREKLKEQEQANAQESDQEATTANNVMAKEETLVIKPSGSLSRGKRLVELSRKRKGGQPRPTEQRKVAKRPNTNTSTAKPVLTEKPVSQSKSDPPKAHLKRINRDLLTIDTDTSIGSGSFGKCYPGLYRDSFRVVVKEIKTHDDSTKELERAKREVLNEAAVIAALGDHPGVPHLFGVCTEKPPYYLVLQHHAVEGRSITLSRAVSDGMISSNEECAIVLRKTCEALIHLHKNGYLHNDLKGNNVVLDGDAPVIIDFGKSCQIAKAKLRKPKLDVDKAIARYPHIAPEIHRGEKQTTSSDVYSFGAMIARVLKDGKFEIPTLKQASRKCLSSNPRKRPSLEELLQKIAI